MVKMLALMLKKQLRDFLDRGIKMKNDFRKRLVAATPLICLIIYLFVGFYFHIWHPTWTIFFFIPIMPIILGLQKITYSYSLLCSIIYVVLGIFCDLWHPGWLIFLTIPVFHILFPPKKQTFKGKINID